MLFHVKKPKAFQKKTFNKTLYYKYALDGEDIKRGYYGFVVFKRGQQLPALNAFTHHWLMQDFNDRVIFVKLLEKYGPEVAAEAVLAFEAGWKQDATFMGLLLDAAHQQRRSFPGQMKSYSKRL